MGAFEADRDVTERLELQKGRAYAAKVVQAPATVSEGLLVRLADGNLTYGPMPWPGPRGTDLPGVDDDVLITMDDEGQWWCVAWWPYGEIA